MPQTLIRDLFCFDSPLAISKYSSLYLRETLPLASPGHPSLLFLISPELSSKVNTAENGAQSQHPSTSPTERLGCQHQLRGSSSGVLVLRTAGARSG